MDVPVMIEQLQRTLEQAATPERAAKEKAYLKSDLTFLGARMPVVRRAAKAVHRTTPELPRETLLALVEALWRTDVFELRSVGVALLALYQARLRAGDMALVEELLRRTATWAHVDWLSTSVAGPLVARFASAKRALPRWSRDENFWLRRAAMLALLPELRKGGGDFAMFARFAGAMIQEKEFFIRKAIGWVLRETSKKQPAIVYKFLYNNIEVVAGLTLREGAKYLPEEQRRGLLERYKSR